MNTLPLKTTSYGWTLTQIKRDRTRAIYEQSKDGQVCAYEVIRIEVAKPFTIAGKEYPEREVYPKSEDWGRTGWTCMTHDAAISRYQSLV